MFIKILNYMAQTIQTSSETTQRCRQTNVSWKRPKAERQMKVVSVLKRLSNQEMAAAVAKHKQSNHMLTHQL